MMDSTQNEFSNGGNAPMNVPISEAERTLRLIAHLPAPQGLADRVQSRLRASHTDAPRAARILEWPAALRPSSSWMRTAAAAAIVFVVAGGGWGVYSRIQPPQSAKVIVMPPRVGSPGGFSNASAMHVPNTLNGPIIANPANPAPANAAQPKAVAPGAKKPVRRAHAIATAKPANQANPAAPK